VNDKYEFIDGEKYAYPIAKMCGWLHVSRAGFYEWRNRPASATAERRARLTEHIRAVFDGSRQTYGHRRVHAALGRAGVPCSLELVRHLMRAAGLRPCQPRPFRTTTVAAVDATVVPDRVRREFTAPGPGQRLVGDITYIRTWEGFAYLATVIDCCTKMVVGWAFDTHMRAELVTRAIDMAAGNIGLAPGAVFHSDRGCQYTSDEFRRHLKARGILPSVGRTGVCWDNAMAESFFGALKNELVYRTVFPTVAHARHAVVEYIEVFYNRQRLHSAIGYRTPAEARAAHLQTLQAA
jgi:transposase InsO family protein